MKLSNQLGPQAAILVTYGILLLIIFIAVYNLEWYPASIFTGLLVFFTIFLMIRKESWEKLKWSPTGGFEVTRNLKDVVKEGRKIKISKKAEKQATDTLKRIKQGTKDSRLELIGLWIETERKLRELGKTMGLAYSEYRPPIFLMHKLKVKGIIDSWLLSSLTAFYNYRNRAVHGYELTKQEKDWGTKLARIILAKLNEELKKQFS